MLKEMLDAFESVRHYFLEVYCFGSEKQELEPRAFTNACAEKINAEFWRRLKNQVHPDVPDGEQGNTLFYDPPEPVDLTVADLALPSRQKLLQIPVLEEVSSFLLQPHELSDAEQFILGLFEAAKEVWDPRTNPNLYYLAQCMGWNQKNMNRVCYEFEEIFADEHQHTEFWNAQHRILLSLYFDLASCLIENMRPHLLMIDKRGHDKHNINDLIRLDLMLEAEAFGDSSSASHPGASPKEQFHKFLRELEQKYPDLPMGEDLYERPMEEGGKDFLDAIHFYTPYKSQAYGSFSLWQILRKVVYHERYRSIPHERLWSYALDLGIHAARLVAIDATKPLGAQIQTAIREGTYDREHYLYRSFYIYLHNDYLIAVLPDDIAYWGFGFGDTPDLRDQPLSWRPDSLAGYDYSQMELLYMPPSAEPEGPGWYLRRTGFERVN
jgi:hypothetical protein